MLFDTFKEIRAYQNAPYAGVIYYTYGPVRAGCVGPGDSGDFLVVILGS